MKRVLLLCLIGFALLIGTVAYVSASNPYYEGFDLSLSRGYTIAHFELEIHAVKSVDGRVRASSVDLEFLGGADNPVVIEERLPFPEDADELEVSRDLGWAGLNMATLAFDQTSVSYVPVEIHLSLYGTQPYSLNGSYYVRPARITGTVTINGQVIDFGRPPSPANYETASIFSTRQP